MTGKARIGIVLIVLGIAAVGLTIHMIHSNMVTTGPTAGTIAAYRPPFKNHGLVAVLVAIGGVVTFLVGLGLTGFGRNRM